MRGITLTIAASALFLSATTSIAQTGWRAAAEREALRKTMYGVASCVTKHSRRSIEEYLRAYPGSVNANREAERLARTDCLASKEYRYNEAILRGAAYEELYRLDYGAQGPTDFAAAPAIDYGAGAPGPDDPGQVAASRQLADCIVRAGPRQARELVLSPVGGTAEADAFRGVTPKIPACLPKDMKLALSKTVLRGLIGETLYRLSAMTDARKGASNA